MKDPAFLFYPNDWMGGTQWFTMEQKGCYLELLVLQFNTGKFTEAQAKQVLSICFDHAWETVKKKFTKEGEFYFNERLKYEIERRAKYAESRRNNGLKPKKTDTKKTEAYASSMLKHMGNENNICISNKKIGVEKFYESQLKESKNNPLFDQFIKILFGESGAGIRCDGILKMEQQVTWAQFQTLIDKAKAKGIKLSDLIYDFENGGYFKGKKSLYLSLNNWINRR